MARPWLSIIIPVFREERGIAALLVDLAHLNGRESVEIIVVDGDPSRSTHAAITDPAIVRVAAGLGRAIQMNAGAKAAQGQVLLFLHADTRLPEQAGALIRQVLKNPVVAGGAFSLAFDSTRPALRLIAAVANLRTRLTRVPYGDQAIFLRRECFLAMNGYTEMPLMEDLDLMRRVRRQGKRIVLLSEQVVTSSRRWQGEGVWRCTLRNWGIRLLFHLGVPAHRLKQYYSTREMP